MGIKKMQAIDNHNTADQRRAARHRTDFDSITESKRYGDLSVHVVNISAHGFMIDDNKELERGDRITIRLPECGHVESLVLWAVDNRAGLQFERVIRIPEFLALLDKVSLTARS